MSDTFAQIDPKPLPQVAAGNQSSRAARSSGTASADGPPDEFEALLSQKTASDAAGDEAQGSTETDQNATPSDTSTAQAPPGDENALTLATALAGIIPGQPIPIAPEASGKSGVKVEGPTLPPTLGGGPPANATPENAASSGESAPGANPAKPGQTGTPGAGQPTPEANLPATGGTSAAGNTSATGAAGTASAAGAAGTAGSLNQPGAPGQASSAAPLPPANTAASGTPAPTDTAQNQAATIAGKVAGTPEEAKPARTSETRKPTATTPAKAQNTSTSGLTTAQATLAIERILGDAPRGATPGGDTGTIIPGDGPLNQSTGTTLRVASPMTPGSPPNLPIRSIALSMVQQSTQGIRQFTINLSPASLGRIQVDMEIGKDGRVSANLTVDRPDTLDALQRDARALERALQNAGLKPDQGSLNFSLRDQQNGREATGREASDRDQPARDIQPLLDQAPRQSISLSALDISV